MKILGIETSCDETAAAMLEFPRLRPSGFGGQANLKIQILSNVVASQVEIHKKYGGIVPEVAARQHIQSVIPVIQEALIINLKSEYRNSKQFLNSKSKFSKPDLIAVTTGPGLITSLQVGVQTAKTLAYVWGVPLVGVNHLEAHLWSFLLNEELGIRNKELEFPAIGLVISGGHTEMVLVKGIGKYQLIGRTRDDAVGEAFDKVAKLLNLGYPGGPIISHYAKYGQANKIKFPRPMIDSPDFDFSFSGIKTAVKYYLKDLVPTGQLSQAMVKDVCASFQQAVIDVLTYKVIKAAKEFKAKSIILGGGVSANESLIKELGIRNKPARQLAAGMAGGELGINFYYPQKEFTGDNAAMVALCGFLNKKSASKLNWRKLAAAPNLKIICI